MTKKEEDLKKINQHFDSIVTSLEGYVDSTRQLMPLTSMILNVAKESVKMYKQAFNEGLKNK